MKKILLILFVFSTTFSFSQIKRGISAFNFTSDIFIGGNIGPNLFMSEGFSNYGLKNSLGFSESFFIGKNFSERLGARAMISLASMSWPDLSSINYPVKKFSIQSFNAEILYNLSNQFGVYNLNRPVDYQLYVGGGVLSREKATFQNEYLGLMVKGGLQADIRLNFMWDVNINAGMTVVPEGFNELIIGLPFEIIPELKIGITYHSRAPRRY